MLLYIVVAIIGFPLSIIAGIVAFNRNDEPIFVKPAIIAGVTIMTMLSLYFVRQSQMMVPEMLHYQYTQISYYEPWNEYISETCTRQNCTGSGKDQTCTTESYDCSYVKEHSEYWEAVVNDGSDVQVSQEQFMEASILWGNKTFIDMNRDFHSIDGNAYRTIMPMKDNYPTSPKILGYSTVGSYKNKIVSSKSVFKFKNVSPDEVKSYGLYDWNGSSLMGSPDKYATMVLNNTNYLYGLPRQMSLRILLFPGKGIESAFMQESYWNGGNKNEFNVCIGYDSDSSISWVKAISWTTNELLKIEIRDSIVGMKKLNLPQISRYLSDYVPNRFVKRSFKEFEYLPDPASGYMYVIGIIIPLLAFIICLIVTLKTSGSKYKSHGWGNGPGYTGRRF